MRILKESFEDGIEDLDVRFFQGTSICKKKVGDGTQCPVPCLRVCVPQSVFDIVEG
jgi:hypothetical protein